MRSYECMTILDPALDEEQRNQLIERFTSILSAGGAEVKKTDHWGKRRLAYPIKGKEEGYYVLFAFRADHAATREFERVMKITDGVVRYLLVRTGDEEKNGQHEQKNAQ